MLFPSKKSVCIYMAMYMLFSYPGPHPSLWKMGSGEGRYPYEKTRRGAIVAMFRVKTQGFIRPMMRVGSLCVLIRRNEIETTIYIYIYMLAPDPEIHVSAVLNVSFSMKIVVCLMCAQVERFLSKWRWSESVCYHVVLYVFMKRHGAATHSHRKIRRLL